MCGGTIERLADMKTYWIYDGCWKRVTPERYLAYDGIKEIRDGEFCHAKPDFCDKRLNSGGFVPFEEYKCPNPDGLDVCRMMWRHGIMPDKKDMDRISEAVAEALKTNLIPNVRR